MGKSKSAGLMSIVSPSTSARMGAEEKAAKAAGNAAMAAQREARARYKETADIVNPATIQGLLSFDRDIKNQEKNLSRQEQLISNLDPAIIEASQQALKLMRGEESSTLAPLKSQRNQQRQRLLNRLREQLGPGAETSTAGMQALNQFDMETDSLYSGAQQQALGNLGNISSQFTSQRPDMAREIGALSAFGQGKANLSFQQAAALSNARAGLAQTAGAQYTGDLLKAQSQASMISGIQNMGIQAVGAYFTGGASLAAGAGQKQGGGGGGQSVSSQPWSGSMSDGGGFYTGQPGFGK